MRRYLFIAYWLCVTMLVSATQRVVSLQNDTTVMGVWSIAAGDTLTLRLNGHRLTLDGDRDYVDFGFHVQGMLTIEGSNTDVIRHGHAIRQFVSIDGGTVEIKGGLWQSQISRNAIFVQNNGALHIENGVFRPDGELLKATQDTLSISGGTFYAGVTSEWFGLGPAMRTSLQGGRFERDPRASGMDADYGFEVYGMTAPSLNFYVGPAHTDTTVLDTVGYCWGDTIRHNGRVITAPGLYTDTLYNRCGGDSIVVLPVEWNCTEPVYVYHIDSIKACDSLQWQGKWYYRGGLYYGDTIALGNWRDSVLMLYLELDPTQMFHKSARACDMYQWRGRTLTESGDYYDTLKTVSCGCDSIFHLSLTLGHSTQIYRDTAHICVGQSYRWQGNTYSRAGVYQQVLQTAFPCDSFVELHLLIDALTLDSVPALSLHGHRMVLLDHAALTEQGYHFATDSVAWYRVVDEPDDPRYPTEGNDEWVGKGDFYTGNGQPLQGDYYALIHTENADECRLPLRTIILHAPSQQRVSSVSLSPVVATAGMPIRVSGLDANTQYNVRVLSPSGLLLHATSLHDADSYVFDAAGSPGCYFVSVQSDTEIVSLRYIVQ